MITVKCHGSFKNTERFLNRATKLDIERILHKYGEAGVAALAAATPRETGATANAWRYEIQNTRTSKKVTWYNDNVNKGVQIAVILQYGHGTNNGGYVQGRDYINPALRPIFDAIAEDAWREVTE